MKRLFLLFLLTGLLTAGEPKIFVHAPAEDLLGLLNDKGAGYLISIEEYRQLVAKARASVAESRERSPLDARIVRGDVTGRIDGEVLRLEGAYAVVVQSPRAEVAFPLHEVALEKAAVEGGELVGDRLRFEKPGTYMVTATLSARLRSADGLVRTGFRLPPAAAHTLRVELPPEVEGEVGPIVRSFSSGADGGAVVGYPDGRGLFQLWYRKRAPARRLEPIVSAAFDTVATIGEARTVTRTQLDLEILRAPMVRVVLTLPTGQTIRALQGKGVKNWKLVRGETDRLEISFVEPVQRTVRLEIEAELPRDDSGAVAVPLVRLPAAVRYRGTVGLGADPQVRVTALDGSGARRLDRRDQARFAIYEVWSQEARVVATVERVVSRTRARSATRLLFHEGGKSLAVRFQYEITGRELFRLEPRVPAGWIIGTLTLDGKAADYRYEDDGRLVLDIPAGLKPGSHHLDVALHTDEVDWVPAEGSATFSLADVRSGLDEESGYLLVASDPAFRVSLTSSTGVRRVGLDELFGSRAAPPNILYAWAYDSPDHAAGFALERHQPQLSATVVERLLPSEKLLSVVADIWVRIERAGVRELRVALPRGTGPLARFDGALIKEKRAPAETESGPEVWTLVFHKRVRGEYRLRVAFDREQDSETWEARVPEIVVEGAQVRGFVVVQPSGTTAVSVERGGLREADVGELPEPLARAPLEVLAYAQHPFEVTLRSRKHAPHAVLQAIALSAHIYGVLSPEGRLRCRAEYRIRNNDRPFLEFALPEGSELLGVLVDGKPAKPLLEAGRLKLPLPRSRGREELFAVAIVYDSVIEELEMSGDVTVGRPQLDLDVLKTTYTLHLPRGYQLTGHDGDLVPLADEERPTVLGDLSQVAQIVPMTRARVELEANAAGDPGSPELPGTAGAPPPAPSDPGDPAETTLDRFRKFEGKSDGRGARDEGRLGEEDADYEDELPEEEPSADAAFEVRTELAEGAKRPRAPTKPKGKAPPERRARAKRALLSLDVQFLRSDNVYRLESMAPGGAVTLTFARAEVFERRFFLGIVFGAAAAVLLFLRGASALLRVLPAIILGVLALHFAGLSFLPLDFARGAAQAFGAALLVLLVVRALRALGRIRLRRGGAAVPLLLFGATAAHADDTIFVPYGKDPEAVERVFLDSKEYLRLRRLADPLQAERGTAFAEAYYRGGLAGEELIVEARYAIVKETARAERIPLRLDDVAVTKALLNGKPATLSVHKKGYLLVLAGAGRYELQLTLRPRLVAKGEARGFAIPVVPVSNARFEIVHDREGHDLQRIGLGAGSHIGPVATLGASWTPRTEGFEAPAAELRAHTELFVSLRDGYTAVAARIRYGITGGTADRFRVRVDPGLVVRGVACKHLAGWEIGADGVLAVALSRAAERSHAITILAERPAAREREEALPAIAPLDVVRDAGVVALETHADLKVDILETQGLLRGRKDQAPKKLTAAADRGVVHSVHRFAVRPVALRWRVFLEQTRMTAETLVDLFVDSDEAVVWARVTARVERGPGPFLLRVRLPAGYEVEQVGGAVRDWWVNEGVLEVALLERLKQALQIPLILRRRGATSTRFEAPAISVDGALRETGLLRVSIGRGLELEAAEASNLLPADVAKAGAGARGKLVRAYRYVAVPWRLLVAARPEAREVEGTVVSRVVPLLDRVRVEALVHFAVRRGLVDEISFVVPTADAAEVLIDATDLREERSEPVEGGVRFHLTLRTPTASGASAAVTYFLPYDAPVRGIEPIGVARTRRHLALEKVPDGSVRVTDTDQLEEGTFDDLPLQLPGTTAQTVARVYTGSGGPYSLTVQVARHSFQNVAKAVVYRAAAQAVVDRSGWARVLVVYRIYNRSEQFLRLRLPEGATLYSALVAGEGVRPLADGRQILVPLRKVALGAPTFDVDVVYAYKGPRVGDDDFEVSVPDIDELEIQRTSLSLHLPPGYSYSFDTEMQEAEEADLSAGEAADVYQEIKELYDVAQRGNALQAQRALSNLDRLEAEAKRAADKVQSLTRDAGKLAQVEQQQAALSSLRRSMDYKRDQTVQADDDDRVTRVEDWDVNEGYLAKNKRADLSHLEGLKRGQQPVASAGVSITMSETIEITDKGGDGALDDNTAFFFGVVSEPRSLQYNDGKTAQADQLRNDLRGAGGRSITEQTARIDALQNDKEFAQKLLDSGVKGRISLRIDLPREGEVYHFSAPGKHARVRFDADESDGSFFEGLLALVCAAAGLFVMRYRAS